MRRIHEVYHSRIQLKIDQDIQNNKNPKITYVFFEDIEIGSRKDDERKYNVADRIKQSVFHFYLFLFLFLL